MELRYQMIDVIPLLPIPQPPYGKMKYDIPCPLCDNPNTRHGKLNINLKKNVFRCNKCGEFSGGVLDLYAYYMNIRKEDALSALQGKMPDYSFNQKRRVERKKMNIPETPKEAALADIETRNQTYQALLNKLSLAPDHREDLWRRGLGDEAIDKLQYRTTPAAGFHALAKELADEGHQLFGVPGFYTDDDGRWVLNSVRRGVMIPCRDRLGRIERIHVRIDKERRNKFRPLSSVDKLNGCATENWCHLAGPVSECIFLIEGYMKADIVHYFTGMTVLAVPGVTGLHHLESTLNELIQHGTKHIMTCFDMDYLKNWHVEGAYTKLIELLSSMNITFGTYLWQPEYNGLDDYIWEYCLNSGKNTSGIIEIVTQQKALLSYVAQKNAHSSCK